MKTKTYLWIAASITILIIGMSSSIMAFPGQTATHKKIYKDLSAEDKAQFDALPDGQKLMIMQRLEMEQAAKAHGDAYNVPGMGKVEKGQAVDAYLRDEKRWVKGKVDSIMMVDGKRNYRIKVDDWNADLTATQIAKLKTKTGNKSNGKNPYMTKEHTQKMLKAQKGREAENKKLCPPIRSASQCRQKFPRCAWNETRKTCDPTSN
ncbi:MAG: hypothetical protein JJT78_15470 [Leptospira sp.]|nr:hypothetical protein [Leptospira sp.]